MLESISRFFIILLLFKAIVVVHKNKNAPLTIKTYLSFSRWSGEIFLCLYDWQNVVCLFFKRSHFNFYTFFLFSFLGIKLYLKLSAPSKKIHKKEREKKKLHCVVLIKKNKKGDKKYVSKSLSLK